MTNNPYDQIARFYNRIYSKETFYEQAFMFADMYCKKYNLPRKVVDMSCGTGILLGFFHRAGYETFGSDTSVGMLAVAKNDLPLTKFKTASFSEVDFGCEFSIVINIYNSLGYCRTPQDLINTLRHQSNQLTKNGIIIFDIYPQEDKPEIFEVSDMSDDGLFVSRTFYGYPNGKELEFELTHYIVENKKSNLIIERGVNSFLSKNEIENCITQSNLKVIYADQGYMRTSEITFVAQKNQELK